MKKHMSPHYLTALTLLLVIPVLFASCDFIVKNYEFAGVITDADVPLTAPVTGATPQTNFNRPQYSVAVIWDPDDNPFKVNVAYQATITLTERNGWKLDGVEADFFKVPGTLPVTDKGNEVNKGEFTVEFPLTVRLPITASSVDLAAPVTGGAPQETIGHAQYNGTVVWSFWDDSDWEDFTDPLFEADTRYRAKIELEPTLDWTLAGVPENFFSVLGAVLGPTNAAGSGEFTVEFPETE
ncbi:MAG: hypothetical protein FWG89_04595 [Treponema sp.]|nr:hypothetical protein [Treponema sp.]